MTTFVDRSDSCLVECRFGCALKRSIRHSLIFHSLSDDCCVEMVVITVIEGHVRCALEVTATLVGVPVATEKYRDYCRTNATRTNKSAVPIEDLCDVSVAICQNVLQVQVVMVYYKFLSL